MNRLFTLMFLLPHLGSFSQATNLERLFIERVNILRDSVQSPPLVNMEEYRMVSYNHANYIIRNNDVSHTQKNTRFPSHLDRCEWFGGGDISCNAEIVTWNTVEQHNDTVVVDLLIESFMSSKPHRYFLLSYLNRSCTVGIYHSLRQNACVVNFANAHAGNKYEKYNWWTLDATEAESELMRTATERFEAFYIRYYDVQEE